MRNRITRSWIAGLLGGTLVVTGTAANEIESPERSPAEPRNAPGRSESVSVRLHAVELGYPGRR